MTLPSERRWGRDLDEQLEASDFGILCLTPDNLTAPWIHFEAGSLAKDPRLAHVIPYRFMLTTTDVAPPLSQFQGVDATREGTLKLAVALNKTLQKARESRSPWQSL